MNEKPSKWKVFTAGIIRENPVLRLVLGCCSALAVTTTVSGAVGMGLAMTFVLVCSNIVISALRKVIPAKVHLPCYIVIIATFVTVVQMVLQAFVPDLYKALGVYLALIVVNCIILGRAEMFACKNTVVDSALDGLGMGIGYILTMLLMSSIREIIGSGTWMGITIIPESVDRMTVMNSAPGGFFVFGCLMAGCVWLERKLNSHLTLAVTLYLKSMQEIVHRGEKASVVRAGGQHHLRVLESISHVLCHIGIAQVAKAHLHALFTKLLGYVLRCLHGASVYACAGDEHALAFASVRAPDVVKMQVFFCLSVQNRAVQRAYALDFQSCELLEHGLDRSAVFAHYVKVVSSRLASPILVFAYGKSARRQSSELAECVCAVQSGVGAVVGHNNLRPVHHRSSDECQGVAAQLELVPVFHCQCILYFEPFEELREHGKGPRARYYHDLWVFLREPLYESGVVRLQVLDYEIVRNPSLERFLKVFLPLLGRAVIGGVEYGHLFVEDKIGVICHSFGKEVLIFK